MPKHLKARLWLLQDMGIIDPDAPPGSGILDHAKAAIECNQEQLPAILSKLEKAGWVVQRTGNA